MRLAEFYDLAAGLSVEPGEPSWTQPDNAVLGIGFIRIRTDHRQATIAAEVDQSIEVALLALRFRAIGYAGDDDHSGVLDPLDHAGEAPSAVWRKMRLAHGHWLLLNTTRTVTQIALECGFADGAHFSRWFHRAYKEAPVALRRRHRQRAGSATR